MDGDLDEVNPGILELAKDPNAWREQRRRAMREKIFGGGGGGAGANGGMESNVSAPLSSSSFSPSSGPATSAEEIAAREAFILQQIQSHKRRRDGNAGGEERTLQPRPFGAGAGAPGQGPAVVGGHSQPAPQQPVPPGGMSLKEQLLQKFGQQQ